MIKIENTEVVGFEPAIRGMRNPMNSWDKSDSVFCNSWVSVNDMLPKRPFYDWVLVKSEFNEGGQTIPHVAELIDGTWRFQSLDSLDAEKTLSIKVTHWMPIENRENTIGPNDHELMMKLVKGGSVHAKFRRMIAVHVDITAPLYWWKEFDTYKIGTVANSCSTMHKLSDKAFTLDDFSGEHLITDWLDEEDIDAFTPVPDYYGNGKCWSPMDILKVNIDALNTNRTAYLKIEDALKHRPNLTADERKHLVAKQKLFWWQMIQLLPSSYNQRRTVMLNYEVLAGLYPMRKEHKLDEWQEFCKWVESLPYSEIITGEI